MSCTRRSVLQAGAVAPAAVWIGSPLLAQAVPVADGARLYHESAAQVLPSGGHTSRVALGDSIVRLTRFGVIDRRKLEALYAQGGGAPQELAQILDRPSPRPIHVTSTNARLYVNLLWPVGLANRMAANFASPINGAARDTFASTGGWTLGREASGGGYFSAFPIVELRGQDEGLVTRVARNTFRPCCNNSTFFQDCNHGSALLGLLALGASQRLDEQQLYREALAFNAFWFPEQYTVIALYFKAVRGADWRDVDPRTVLAAEFSSAGGWQANVVRPLQSRGLPTGQSGSDCRA